MRRALTGLALVVGLASVVPSLPAYAASDDRPDEVLEVAARVLDGDGRTVDPTATLALRDVLLARPGLSGTGRRIADTLLARPSYPSEDDLPTSAPLATQRTCNARICVHHVEQGRHRPRSRAWVDRTLRVMERTWRRQVTQMGYRRPLPDGQRGGDDRFDVYLADLSPGLYGYCTAEKRHRGRTASGFCVLDNDYSHDDYPSGTPAGNLRVTAAHEFFHAVQFAYDFGEDPWLMESTATWMEERLADAIDDNRQYLSQSQLALPHLPLDHASAFGAHQYGNWIFWEHVSARHGNGVVRRTWEEAGSLRRDGGRRSLQAVAAVLEPYGGWRAVLTRFAAANVSPRHAYAEGDAYPYAEPYAVARPTPARRSVVRSMRVDHLAAGTVRLVPARSLRQGWRVRVRVHAEGTPAGGARLVVRTSGGSVRQVPVALDRRGVGHRTVAFDRRRVASVTVVMANASTRMRCRARPRTEYACGGRAKDDGALFTVRATLLR
jgi:hypothetical protein